MYKPRYLKHINRHPEYRIIGGVINLRGRKWMQITDDEVVQIAVSGELRKALSRGSRKDLEDVIEHRELQEYIEEFRNKHIS